MKVYRKHLTRWLPFYLSFLTLATLLLFKNNPQLTEKFYSRGIYPYIANTLSYISSWFSFSLDDLFYLSIILFALTGIVLLFLKRISILKFLLRAFQLLAIVFCLFYWLWGFNYYRAPIRERIHLTNIKTDKAYFVKVFSNIINKTNTTYTTLESYNKNSIDTLIENSFKQSSVFLNINYSSNIRRVKYISLSSFFAKATILGYYGPFFSEVHINKHLTEFDVPLVTGHEKSHQFGITSEAEANFCGWLACVKSDCAFIKYSGWLYALDYFIFESKNIEEKEELIKMIRPEVIQDLRYKHEHWKQWRNKKIDELATTINNAYLKSNSVEKGIEDYNGVVQLIVDFYELEDEF